MNAEDELERLLKDSGAILVRKNKHAVYRLPNGRMFTRSLSPSVRNVATVELACLRRTLSLPAEIRPEAKPEKKKRNHHHHGPRGHLERYADHGSV
jgi:hypothetical protein